MDGLRKKWSSSRGASILMALLFLLVCMMVGASVLMAAASNAGKVKSNRDEQQRYLTLSSALTLLCDELEQVKYVGKYSYKGTPVYRDEPKEDGTPESVYDHTDHVYKQKQGELRDKNGQWGLMIAVPLQNDLDAIFAKSEPPEYFQVPAGQRVPVDNYTYDKRSAIQTGPYTLTLTAGADANTYGGLAEPVTVVVTVGDDGGLVLTASLKNHPEYIMEAVLTTTDKLENCLVLTCPAKETEVNETQPVQWTLDYIVKKGAGG